MDTGRYRVVPISGKCMCVFAGRVFIPKENCESISIERGRVKRNFMVRAKSICEVSTRKTPGFLQIYIHIQEAQDAEPNQVGEMKQLTAQNRSVVSIPITCQRLAISGKHYRPNIPVIQRE